MRLVCRIRFTHLDITTLFERPIVSGRRRMHTESGRCCWNEKKTDNGDYRREQVPRTRPPSPLLIIMGALSPHRRNRFSDETKKKKVRQLCSLQMYFCCGENRKKRRTSRLEENRSCILYEPISPAGYIVCRAGMNPSFPIGCIVPRMQGRSSKRRRTRRFLFPPPFFYVEELGKEEASWFSPAA